MVPIGITLLAEPKVASVGQNKPWRILGHRQMTKSSGIWSMLPSFDPSTDNAREYLAKVKFLDGICPKKDRPMLAPRLAMLCKGTAWHQVRALSPELLTDPTNGIKHYLAALESWEESTELRTFELFDRAIYKTFRSQMNQRRAM